MRKRNHIIPLHLNKKELAHLETQVKQSGLPREEFLRTLIMGAELRAKPCNHHADLLHKVAGLCNTGEIAHHSGTDIGAPGGTPILAAADGTVTIANAIDSWGGGYGYHIKISHNDTFDTLYAHCSSICVTVGQEVKQGEVIGYVGTTGNSTGNHLHFEVWQNGERTDALGYFKAKG